MLRRSAALTGEGWVRRNRRDPQQGAQTVKTPVDISVDAVENRVECAHAQLRKGKPIGKPGDQPVALYILILAGLFGNIGNATSASATSNSSFMIAPMATIHFAEIGWRSTSQLLAGNELHLSSPHNVI